MSVQIQTAGLQTGETPPHTPVHGGIAPHGGHLINRLLAGEEAVDLRRRAEGLPSVQLSARQLSDLALIGNGAFSPLDGFMGPDDYDRVVRELHLANGLPWSLPVTLAVDAAAAPSPGTEVALRDAAGALRGILTVQTVYQHEKAREAREVYGTEDAAHPGGAGVYAQGGNPVGGPGSGRAGER